jgi:hypothetical protein
MLGSQQKMGRDMNLTGKFKILDWQETVELELTATTRLSVAEIKQAYNGDITGNSVVKYQLYYKNSTHALFNGFEIISYEREGTTASLIAKHDGKFENGIATSTFLITDASHDKHLIGLIGFFESTENGIAQYQIK